MTEIDKIDRKILSILQGDGRIANVELAERIGLSPTSIGERLKRLQRDGFIEGYGARLNPHRLGLGLLVFVEVMLDKTTPTCSSGSLAPCRRPRKCWSATWWRAASTIW